MFVLLVRKSSVRKDTQDWKRQEPENAFNRHNRELPDEEFALGPSPGCTLKLGRYDKK